MTEKMTYVQAIENAINGNLTAETVEKLNALLVSIQKRNASRVGKPSKTAVANAEIGETILATLTAGECYTIAEIGKLVPALEGASSQKIAPIMRKLVDGGHVTCEKVKGKNVYRLA